MSILDRIVASTRARVEREKAARPLESLHPRVRLEPFAFAAALRHADISFICEVKKASPSKGVIAEHFPYIDIARDYESAGAAAISVLTEPEFFQGSDRIFEEIRGAVSVPLLRKDFLIDRYQLHQAAALGADAVLLICAILHPLELELFLREAHALGLSALVEAHDESEVEMALAAGANIIGVNNRDLRTFEVNTATSERLRRIVPPDVLFVSESGIRAAADVARLRAAGVDAVLVGESLMRSGDKRRALAELRGTAP